MTILLTGFNPFGGDDRNPSGEAVSFVGRHYVGQGKLVTEVLRTEFACGGDRLIELLTTHRPAVWIGIGLNQGAPGIVLERVAVNLDDARIGDNAGDQRQNAVIAPDGPATLPSTLPLEALRDALSSAGLPTTFSDSAGRFVCNHVFYRGCHRALQNGWPTRCGFIHVPWPIDWRPSDWSPPGEWSRPSRDWVPASTMTFAQNTLALELCVQVMASDRFVSPAT
jgi:pyroglutamyl-peptidase